MRKRLSILVAFALVLGIALFGGAGSVQADTACKCFGLSPIPVCVDPFVNSPDSSICGVSTSGFSCSCHENTGCGHHSQPACTAIPQWAEASILLVANTPVVGPAFHDFYLKTTGINFELGFEHYNQICRDTGDTGFIVDDSLAGLLLGQRLCAATQLEANEFAAHLAAIPQFNLCAQAGSPPQCAECVGRKGVWTAVGCIPTNRSDIVSAFLTIAISLSGGVILLRLLQASFMLSTSQGEPNKVKEAQEIFTSSFVGLLFVLFSIVLLNFIGVTILRIPGF